MSAYGNCYVCNKSYSGMCKCNAYICSECTDKHICCWYGFGSTKDKCDPKACPATSRICSLCNSGFCKNHLNHNHIAEHYTTYRTAKKCSICGKPSGTSDRCSGHSKRTNTYDSNGRLIYTGR